MRNVLATTLFAAALSACAYDAGGVDPNATPLRSELGKRAFLDLGADSRIGVTAVGPDGHVMPGVAPAVNGGRAVLRSTDDGFVVVEDLDIKLADVDVPADTFGKPIHLTNLVLRLGTQIDVDGDWADSGMSVTGTGKADLLLDWAWRLDDGSIYPLATQKLKDATFDVSARELDDGRLTAAVWMTKPGELRNFADRVMLRDLSLAVVAQRN
ncbi:MAG TPA: hypothetical protein VL463_09370 [Kofleriaceae bacterium]|nr:hypothetical protein [Kofleriaceae bacterium]